MIRAVSRALAIFDAFDKDHLSLTLHEIGERIGMPKATTFRLVNTLERAGFLVRRDNLEYCLSLKLVRLAGMVHSTLSIRDIARPVMVEVNRRTSETIALNTLAGNERVCIDAIDTPSPLMTIAHPGDHVPLLYGAAGRILMAYMEEKELSAVLKTSPGGKSIDRKALERELARFRQQGYALTRGQRVQGITAIAVPIFDAEGRVRNNLLLTGPSVRVDPRDTEFVDFMLEAGRDVSNRIGASAPPKTAAVMAQAKAATARKTAVRKPASASAARSRKA
jgi:DNA-binding IclR family transcriptional regulator